MTTVWADWGFLFIVGLLFGSSNSRQVVKSGSLFFNRYYRFALIFQTIFCMPLAIYCYVTFPDWCWMYWLEGDKVKFFWVVLSFFGYYVAMSIGFGVGALAEQRKPGSGQILLRYSSLIFLAFLFIFFRRLFFVGSIEEFRQGELPFIFQREPLFVLLVTGFSLAIAMLVYILTYLGRDLDRQWSKEDQMNFERRRRIVSIVRVDTNIKNCLKNSLELWDGLEYLKTLIARKGPRIIIKPNLSGGGKDLAGTQTSPELLSALIDIIRELSKEAEIIVVESASIFWWSLEPCYLGSNYERMVSEKKVRFLNLSKEPRIPYDIGGRFGKDLFPAILFEPHILIDVPVAKTHAYFRMSGALKNLFGLTPSAHKLIRYHTKGFADTKGQIFIDLYRAFTPDLVIVDGIMSCEGEGPFGSCKQTNFIITSDDAICADIVLAKIMGYPLKAIPYLQILEQAGFNPHFEEVGIGVSEISPESWKKPSARILSLIINLLHIWRHQRRIKKSYRKNKL